MIGLTMLAFACYAQSQEPVATIPMTLRDRIAVVDIDGYKLAIDSGSSLTVMRSKALLALLEEEGAPLEKSGIWLQNAIGFDDKVLASFDKAGSVDGLIGIDALARGVFGFDYRNQQLTIWPTGVSREDEVNWVSGQSKGFTPVELPVDASSSVVAIASSSGRPMVLDSGAYACSVKSPPPTAVRLHSQPTGARLREHACRRLGSARPSTG